MPKNTLIVRKKLQILRSARGSAPRPPFSYLLQLETFSARTSSIRLLPSSRTYGCNRAFLQFLTLDLDQLLMPPKIKTLTTKYSFMATPLLRVAITLIRNSQY